MDTEKLHRLIKGKNILILGYGREGKTTYDLLRKCFADLKLTIADKQKTIDDIEKLKKDKNLALVLGDKYLENINKYDLIIKSPGIALHKLQVKVPQKIITSQSDLFLRLYSDQVIGVTGTKGKSTTSSLIYHIIKSHTDNTVLVGNIGTPPFEVIDRIDDDTIIVFELSCHQLIHINVSPHIAIMLNLFQEHLDFYDTFEDYALAKFNITKYQNESDYFIFNSDNEEIVKLLRKYYKSMSYYSYSLENDTDNGCIVRNNKVIYISEGKLEQVYDLTNNRSLKGKHNDLNLMAAIIACKLSEVPSKVISDGINSFNGLNHRMEFVGKYKGVNFYNDSIATIPEATIEAVKALRNVDTLILGGLDRGIDYSQLIIFLLKSEINNLIFLGDAGKRINNQLKAQNTKLKAFLVKDMIEAVKIAKSITAKDKICLLSPAAASYDMFKDFEERGNTFIELVKNK